MKTTHAENNTKKLIDGLNKAANIITSSMGASGSTVIISSSNGELNITKDGVSIARSIQLPDPIENIGAQLLISAANETVKQVGDGPQPLYSKVLTPNGFVPMGSLRVGDIISGTDNTSQKVLAVFPKGEKEIYEVKYMDGRVVECCSDHLWAVTTNAGKEKVMTTNEMLESDKIVTTKSCGSRQFNYYTPRTKVDFTHKEVPLDPYLLGCFIGDGSVCGKSINLSLGKSKQHILDKIPTEYINRIKWSERKNCYTVSFSNKIIPLLKNANIYGYKSHNKFIPEQYLYNSEKVRNQLLQGLLDTDGHINKRNRFEYSTVSKQLAKDFVELTRTLGIPTNKRKTKGNVKKGSYSNSVKYIVTELFGYKYGNKIVDIVPTGKYTEMQCILVSNPDHLYITDNYIVTHNTTLTSLLLQKMVASVKSREDLNKLVSEVNELKEYINSNTKLLTTTDEIYSIAYTSSNDKYVAELIKDIYDQTSLTTHIELELTEESTTTITVDKGLKLNSGFDNAWEITDTFSQTATYEDPTFYITQEAIHHPSERIKKLTKLAMQEDMPLVFIADKFSREFKSFVQAQILGGKAKLLMLKMSDFYGEDKLHQYENLTAYLSKDSTALKITSNPYYSIIYNDDHNGIEQRLEQLKALSSSAIDPLDAKIIEKNYHQLSGDIATIWVGGKTKEETKELYDRIEDAVGATKAASQYGYVIGMGKLMYNFTILPGAQVRTFTEIWQAPYKKILENASLDYFPLRDKWELGADLTTGKLRNLIENGIIDPAQTLITALEGALANTKLVLNTKHILYNEL